MNYSKSPSGDLGVFDFSDETQVSDILCYRMLKAYIILLFTVFVVGIIFPNSSYIVTNDKPLVFSTEFVSDSDFDIFLTSGVLLIDEEEDAQDFFKFLAKIVLQNKVKRKANAVYSPNFKRLNTCSFRLYIPLLYNLPPPILF